MIEPIAYYFEEPLYSENEYGKDDFELLYNIVFYKGKVDAYCPFCKKDSIFKSKPLYPEAKDSSDNPFSKKHLDTFEKFKAEKTIRFFKDSEFTLSFNCQRKEYSGHVIVFHTKFITEDIIKEKFFKVGQYPTLASLKDYKTNNYKKVLPNNKFLELNKAIGLASHGVGIGSFVYFRRIFEHLIFETYESNIHIVSKDISEVGFRSLKMKKKIETLKPFLPQFLVENKDLYGIMSLGIHELEEKKCLEIHKTIELGIKLILEEKLESYQTEKLKAEYTEQKNSITNTPPNTAS